MIGKRGNAGDIEYLFEKLIAPDSSPSPIKLKALDALARRPPIATCGPRRIDRLAVLSMGPDRSDLVIEKAAVRFWLVEARSSGRGNQGTGGLAGGRRLAPRRALDALAAIGGRENRRRSRRSPHRPCRQAPGFTRSRPLPKSMSTPRRPGRRDSRAPRPRRVAISRRFWRPS